MNSFYRYNFRPETDNDVIFGGAAEYIGLDVRVKFDDSRSNSARDIRRADFVSNEHIDVYHKRQKRLRVVSPKKLCAKDVLGNIDPYSVMNGRSHTRISPQKL